MAIVIIFTGFHYPIQKLLKFSSHGAIL